MFSIHKPLRTNKFNKKETNSTYIEYTSNVAFEILLCIQKSEIILTIELFRHLNFHFLISDSNENLCKTNTILID